MREASLALEVASRRLVRVDVGEDGRGGLVIFHYLDDPQKRRHTITREAFFLNGYFVAADGSNAESDTHDCGGSAGSSGEV